MDAAGRQQDVRPQPDPATRDRIDEAVLDIFSQREFHRVSLIEIARAARISLQTVYKYYGSKETLLFATLDRTFSRIAGRMIEHLKGIETFQDRLRKVVYLAFDSVEKDPRVAQVILSSVYLNNWSQTDAFRQPQLMGVFREVIREGVEAGVLTDQVDERIILDVIIGIYTRSITMWVLRGQPAGLVDQGHELFGLIWRAIAAPAR